jgi:hypothetical protein
MFARNLSVRLAQLISLTFLLPICLASSQSWLDAPRDEVSQFFCDYRFEHCCPEERNPQFLLRKHLLAFDRLECERSEECIREQCFTMRQELDFILNHSPVESILFTSATFQSRRIDCMLHTHFNCLQDRLEALALLRDHQLREWAPGTNLCGKPLRKAVLFNLRHHPLPQSFINYVLFCAGPDFATGCIKAKEIKLVSVCRNRWGAPCLRCRIKFCDFDNNRDVFFLDL